MADVKQELPMIDGSSLNLWRTGKSREERAMFDDLLALLPLLEPEQIAAVLGVTLPAWDKKCRARQFALFGSDMKTRENVQLRYQLWEAEGKTRAAEDERDAATKRAEAAETAYQVTAVDRAELRAENEKLRAELAETQESLRIRTLSFKSAEDQRLSLNAHCQLLKEELAQTQKAHAEMTTQSLRLRQELATVAERQRASDKAFAHAWLEGEFQLEGVNFADEALAHAPLVTDAPSKPRHMTADLRGIAIWPVALWDIDPNAIAREIAAWPEEADREKARLASIAADLGLSLSVPSNPAPKPEELCAKCGKGKHDARAHTQQGGDFWCIDSFGAFLQPLTFFEPAPPKSRCTCLNSGKPWNYRPGICPEHGVNRPGQGKHMQHEAVVMANEAIRRESAALDGWTDEKCDESIGQCRWEVSERSVFHAIKRRNARIRELEAQVADVLRCAHACDEVDADVKRLRAKCTRQRRELRRLNLERNAALAFECFNRTRRREAEVRIAELESELATLRAEESPEAAWERALQNAHDHYRSVGVVLHLPYQPPEK